jgi:hypothetical protein
MKIKHKIKQGIMLKALQSSAKKQPFDIAKADHFILADQVGDNLTDSHYFSAHGNNGESFFFRHAKRSNSTTEIWFCFRTSDGKTIVNTHELYPSDNCPASVKCTKTGEEMTIKFHGEVSYTKKDEHDVLSFDKESFEITAKATFIASMPAFDFATGLDPMFVAEALANEKWNKTFWRNLKINRQVHYEQPGVIRLEVTNDGQNSMYVLPAMRDHSYGYRDWDYMNRHIWLMILFEDGEVLNLNMVDYPHMRSLMTGYRSRGGRHISVRSLTRLKELGADGLVPLKIEVEVPSKEGIIQKLIGKRDFVGDFSFADGKYHIFEGVGDFIYGDKRGRGILEFGYNSDIRRWK